MAIVRQGIVHIRQSCIKPLISALREDWAVIHTGVVAQQLAVRVKSLGEGARSRNPRIIIVVTPGGDRGLYVRISAVGIELPFDLRRQQGVEFDGFERLLGPAARPGTAPIPVRLTLNSVWIPEPVHGRVVGVV